MGVIGLAGGDPQRGDPAQPGADDRVDAGLRPRRTVRQHRPRLQLGPRHPHGPDAWPTTRSPRPGFAFDLGGEKFFDLKCRAGRTQPGRHRDRGDDPGTQDARRLALGDLANPDPAAVERGLDNLAAHLDGAAHFGKPVVVAINQFSADTPEELERRARLLREPRRPMRHGQRLRRGRRRRDRAGREGRRGRRRTRDPVQAALSPRLAGRAEDRADRPRDVWRRRREYPAGGRGQVPQGPTSSATADLPICMAKTQDSLSDNPKLRGRPRGFTLSVRDIEIAAGGRLPGCADGRHRAHARPAGSPAAERIDVDAEGRITGLS